MLRLDCSSPATTCASLSAIFRVASEEIERRCRALNLEPSAEDPHRSFIELLVGRPAPADELEVIYFHTTRTFPSRRDFAEGLLPLGAAIDGLWSDLHGLVREECAPEAWVEFRSWVERGDVPYPAHQPPRERTSTNPVEQFRQGFGDAETQRGRRVYRMIQDYRERLRAPDRWGPGGFLIRAVALTAAAEASSYEQGHPRPIVEDIAAAYEARFRRDGLLARYLRVTQPCLVTFYDVRPPEGALEVAARYLWTSIRRQECCALVSFDGGGRPVPRERIVGIEEVDPPSTS